MLWGENCTQGPHSMKDTFAQSLSSESNDLFKRQLCRELIPSFRRHGQFL
jgi:hypothetical protein